MAQDHKGTTGKTAAELRQTALDHLWAQSQQWDDLVAEGGPLIIEEGKGVKLKDIDGKWYYDGSSGASLVNIGHGRQELVEAAQKQMASVSYATIFSSATIPTIELAEKVASLTPGDLNHVAFTSGGSEAVETALKLAYQYHVNKGEPQRTKFIARRGSYHGVSLGALNVNSSSYSRRELFEPILAQNARFAPQPLLYHCEFGSTTQSECDVRSAQAIEDLMLEEGPETFAAVIAEPVSQSVGVAVPGSEYWPMLRQICDKYGVLLIADEVITGFGRTGKWFGIDHWNVVPDMMTVAKGITSGYFPVGACVVREPIHDAFKGGPEATYPHGFTYGGHPVGAAVALANIAIMERDHLVENAAAVGDYLLDRLTPLKEHPTVGDVRGVGLLTAVELVKDKATKEPLTSIPGAAKIINDKLVDLGLLTMLRREIFLTPPLPLTMDAADEIVDIVDRSITNVEKELGLA